MAGDTARAQVRVFMTGFRGFEGAGCARVGPPEPRVGPSGPGAAAGVGRGEEVGPPSGGRGRQAELSLLLLGPLPGLLLRHSGTGGAQSGRLRCR